VKRTSRQGAVVFPLTLILIAMLLLQPHSVSAQALNNKPKLSDKKLHQDMLTITVRSSPHAAFISDLQIESREMNAALLGAKQIPDANAAVFPDIDIALLQKDGVKHYRLEHSGQLWNESTAVRTILPKKMAEKLVRLANGLRVHHYGRLISWQESQQLLPNKSIFSVTELETGLSFQVQRRAGSDHADVQPLTKEDTRIMKQIYNDRWSWKRKAVLIHSGDAWIAASMNGMPHGGDGIPENGFSGHFCIHFQGSSTHKSDNPDPAHQMMVHKAAGQVQPYLDSSTPLVLSRSFIEMLYHHDHEMLLLLGDELPKEKLASFMQLMETLVSIREQTPPKAKGKESQSDDSNIGEALTTEIKLPVSIHQLNMPRHNGYYTFLFKRESVKSPWRIQDIAS
jgi:hypothetical protein